jgi:hypothetical protein
VLFRDRDEYVKRLARVEPQIEITLGIYRHAERTAYFYGGPASLTETWRHEATHQLLHEITDATPDVGSAGNFWIVEGIALYMESLQRVDDYCTLGGFDAPRLQYARYRALNERFYVPLDQLVLMGRRQLQEHVDIRRLYTQAAGLAQFLMHDSQGRYRPAAMDFLAAVYRQRDHGGSLTEMSGAADDTGCRIPPVSAGQRRPGTGSPAQPPSNCRWGGGERCGLAHLDDISRLQWLDLAWCHVTDQAIARLRDAANCGSATGTHPDHDEASPRQLDSLEELDLSHTASRTRVCAVGRSEELDGTVAGGKTGYRRGVGASGT